MKKTLRQLIRQARDFAVTIEGGKPKELLVAHEKRRMERELRAQGHSRAEAVALVAQRYRNREKA